MNSLRLTLLIPLLFCFSWGLANSIPYTGKISIRGVNYHGDAQFRFSLHDGNGTTHWENEKYGETIKVSVHNGRYEVFLGGQGMNSLTPELFLKNDPLYLKVEFDLGDGLQHLGPDQLITSTPRALVAEVAKMAESMPSGSISRDMLNAEVLSQLEGKELSDSSAPSVITRDMLSEDIRLDLNKTISITRNMLPSDVLADLNKTVSITRDMLPVDVLADLNKSAPAVGPITLSMLDAEVTAKLDQNTTLADGSVTTAKLDATILKYLKPEITSQPQAQAVYTDTNTTFSVTAEGKYLTYQWKKDGVDLAGETNATLNITDANATLHDGNYSVVVSNDFGSVESDISEFLVSSFSVNSIPNIELWLDSSDSSTITLNNGKVSIWHDKSGNENNATQTLVNKQPEFGQDQNGKFVRFTSSYTSGGADSVLADNYLILSPVSGKSSFFVIDHDGSKLSMLLGSKDSQKSYILIGSDDFAISLDGYNKSPGPLDIGNWWFNGTFQSTGRDLGARGQIPLNTPSMHSVIYELDDPMFSFYRIGSYRDNKAGFGGKIREIIIFNGYLTEADRQNIEGYLAHKWSLNTNLPADHPYKNKSP